MAKLTTPLLSINASGSVGGSLTFRKAPAGHQAIQTPTHGDPRTRAQYYQRERYYDAIQFWHSRSESEKAAFRSSGSRRRLTAYQECIRQYLTDPLDQVLWYRFDEGHGAALIDHSKKGNQGTITGATWTLTHAGHVLSFDAIDDWGNCGAADNLWASSLTVEVRMLVNGYVDNGSALNCPIFRGNLSTPAGHYGLAYNITSQLQFYHHGNNVDSGVAIAGKQVHGAGVYDNSAGKAKIYIDGEFKAQTNSTPLGAATRTLYIGKDDHGLQRLIDGQIGEVRIYIRSLSDHQILHHATVLPPPLQS